MAPRKPRARTPIDRGWLQDLHVQRHNAHVAREEKRYRQAEATAAKRRTGFRLVNPDSGDLLTIGLLAFLAFSPVGRGVLSTIFPDLFGLVRPGEDLGPAGGGAVMPDQVSFRLTSVGVGQGTPLVVTNGSDMTFPVRFTHRGRGGAYVIGVDLVGTWARCWIDGGGAPDPYQNFQADVVVNDDAGYAEYGVDLFGVYGGSGVGPNAGRFYVRDQAGRRYTERWACSLFASA